MRLSSRSRLFVVITESVSLALFALRPTTIVGGRATKVTFDRTDSIRLGSPKFTEPIGIGRLLVVESMATSRERIATPARPSWLLSSLKSPSLGGQIEILKKAPTPMFRRRFHELPRVAFKP